jgi:hypothetical protein
VRACDFFASLFRALRSPGFKKMRLERRGGCSSSLFLLLLSLTTEKDARARAHWQWALLLLLLLKIDESTDR